jgi:hypothetical protein
VPSGVVLPAGPFEFDGVTASAADKRHVAVIERSAIRDITLISFSPLVLPCRLIERRQ